MVAVFLKLLNMSINASWLVLAVLVLRLLLKKAPKWVSVLMWAMVALRLVCPFSLESGFSLIPNPETVPQSIVYAEVPTIQTGIPAINSAVNPVISQNLAPTPGVSVNPMQALTVAAMAVWLVGVVVMLLYALVSYLRIHKKVGEAALLQGNVWLCDRVASPFILGVFRPRIFVPSSMGEGDMSYVLAHEKAHLRRKDHWWKPLGFLLLAVYWFNPLLWLAYILLCRDIELACDEKVIKELGQESKKPYAEALINCSVSRKSIAACPLAFGEVGVKNRIKSVLNYKKPGFWICLLAVLTCIALVVGFLTDPSIARDDAFKVFVDCRIADRHQSKDAEGRACCMDWKVLGTERKGGQTTVYMLVFYEEYTLEGGKLAVQTGCHIPTAITVEKDGSTYKLVEYWEPRDGSYYPTDIREKFPWYLSELAINCQWFVDEQKESCENMAWEYFESQQGTESITLTEPSENASNGDITLESYFDAKVFDIDGDGVEEECHIGLGPTSGIFTFVLSVYENGNPEYFNVYWTRHCRVGFTEDEPVRLKGTPHPNDEDQTVHYFDISIEEGSIILSENGETVPCYEEQGVDSPLAQYYLFWSTPKILRDSELSILDRATFDIDEDGKREDCYLVTGYPDIGMMFCLLAFEGSVVDHYDALYTGHRSLNFIEHEDGSVGIQGIRSEGGESCYFEIGMEDGYIVLRYDDKVLGNNGGDDKDSPYVRMLADAILNPTAPRYDGYGLAAELKRRSSTEFDLIFHHNSKRSTVEGTLTTTCAYAIWGLTEEGYVIPLEQYIRDHLGLEYEEPELCWDDVVYTIEQDKGLTLHFDLRDSYGKLPSGTYWFNKPVTFTDTSGNVSYLHYQITFTIP